MLRVRATIQNKLLHDLPTLLRDTIGFGACHNCDSG